MEGPRTSIKVTDQLPATTGDDSLEENRVTSSFVIYILTKARVYAGRRGREIRALVFQILKALGEKYPDSVMRSKRRVQRPSSDIAIYILRKISS